MGGQSWDGRCWGDRKPGAPGLDGLGLSDRTGDDLKWDDPIGDGQAMDGRVDRRVRLTASRWDAWWRDETDSNDRARESLQCGGWAVLPGRSRRHGRELQRAALEAA